MFRVSLLAVAVSCATLSAQIDDYSKLMSTMKAGPGLQVELFAREPMLINPTSMDVDHLGRVWVAEAVNYRRKGFNRPILREEGDRIQVLIDEKGDGKATKAVTFYQGKEVYGPLSVLVIPQIDGKGLRVLVAQSPDILEFWDKDGDLKADGPPTKWLSGFGGFDHDHGVHGLHIGPDGKLYFTVGDSGVTGLQSKNGNGKKWVSNTTDCQKGTAWRCDLDGNNLELIAHNFRNNYEACVDSFGEIWLSDNDDDGNQQTRICFVFPGGNYGYGPRGAGQTHWHEEQPGIVHKTLRTGFGSPTGIQFYEGNLLPKQYHNTLLHCDAGPREVRAFTRKPKGAGYELDKTVVLTSTDNWFRPSDVCTAPDGSVFVADWYDPGVGGHGMGDHTRGRIYRITPTGQTGYKVRELKLDSAGGILAGLGSPNMATRAVSFDALAAKSPAEITKIVNDAGNLEDRKLIGRTVWLFGNIRSTRLTGGADEAFLRNEIVKRFKADPKTRSAWVGWLSRSGSFGSLASPTPQPRIKDQGYGGYEDDSDPGVIRDVILSLRVHPGEGIIRYFYPLAKKYDGTDIFYRAALNIACGADQARRDTILADFEKHFPNWSDSVADLVWELRPKSMLPKMEKLLTDAKLTASQKARIVDIIAASDDPAAGRTALNLLSGDAPPEVKLRAMEQLKLFLPTKWASLKKGDEIRTAISAHLKEKSPIFGIGLAVAAPECTRIEDLQAVVTNANLHLDVRRAAVAACGRIRVAKMTQFLMSLSADGDLGAPAVAAVGDQITGQGNDPTSRGALDALQTVLMNQQAKQPQRTAALTALAGSRAGTGWLISLKERGGFPETMVADAGRMLRNSPFQGERNRAILAFPAPGKLDPKKLPAISELIKRTGDVKRGEAVFKASTQNDAQCARCHMVRGVGGNIGPDLSMIGKKASKENLYDSMLTPSKAIADQYLQWKVDTNDGKSITGLMVGDTKEAVTVRDANGKDHVIARSTLDGDPKKSQVSLMPDNLVAALTEEQLIDLVEYMTTLKSAALTPDSWWVAGPFLGGPDLLGSKFGPESGLFDPAAKFPQRSDLKPGDRSGEVRWRMVPVDAKGYLDLAALHGNDGANSASFLARQIESPVEQAAEILIGSDDGCVVYVNGKEVLKVRETRAAAPAQNRVTVKLSAGVNTVMMKVANGSNPHGAYLTILSDQELKLKK